MEKIFLSDSDRIIVQGHNSRGNQLKFKKDDVWYKVDYDGYEGLSEYVVSQILFHSNVEYFVPYNQVKIEYNGREYLGCSSPNFLPDGCDLLTVSRMFLSCFGKDILTVCQVENDLEKTVDNFVSNLSMMTGLSSQSIGAYLTAIFELDSLVLNDDRHFNNIAFIRTPDNKIFPAPVFDNGAAFLSDEQYYFSVSGNLQKLIDKANAKPFATFARQKEVFRKLYGKQLEIRNFSINKVLADTIYPEETINRLKNIFQIQKEKNTEILIPSGTKKRNINRDIGLER